MAQRQAWAAAIGSSPIAALPAQNQIVCDCLGPFAFSGLKNFSAMSGSGQGMEHA
jgi:hypothetical protein